MGNTAIITLVEHDAVFWIRLGPEVSIGAGGTIRELSVTLPEEECQKHHVKTFIRYLIFT